MVLMEAGEQQSRQIVAVYAKNASYGIGSCPGYIKKVVANDSYLGNVENRSI